MLNRRLVTAVILSLGFHIALLAAVSLGTKPIPDISELNADQRRTISTTVQLTAPTTDPLAVASVPNPPPNSEPETEPDIEQSVIEVSEAKADIVNEERTAKISSSHHLPAAVAPGFSAPAKGDARHSNAHADSEPSLLSVLDPEYPILARRMGVEGVVVLDVTVDRMGFPVDCLILPPHSHRFLEESALAAVMQARFQPGTEDGRPVRDTFRLKIRFELET